MTDPTPTAARQRIDKWLWYARVVKTRSLAAKIVKAGDVRVNRNRVTSASHQLSLGDVLTINLPTRVRILKVVDAGTRRGPAAEAATLWEDLTPPPPPKPSRTATSGEREPGSGRPTKKQRRELDKFFQQS